MLPGVGTQTIVCIVKIHFTGIHISKQGVLDKIGTTVVYGQRLIFVWDTGKHQRVPRQHTAWGSFDRVPLIDEINKLPTHRKIHQSL